MKNPWSDVWKMGERAVGFIGAILAIPVFWLTYQVYSRQLGYDQVGIRFRQALVAGPPMGRALTKPTGYGRDMIVLSTLNDMALWNPAVVIETSDDTPLEALRLQITPVDGVVDASDEFHEADAAPTPWALEGMTTRDYPITARPGKGQAIVLAVADLLVRQMSQVQVKEPARRHRIHYGKYLVQVFAKPAGSPTWSQESDGKAIAFMFCWYPDGFSEDECARFVGAFSQPPKITN